ncbi:probable N-acetylgalactosaminyltransferase 8 isoform X2 [Patella vulgata]|uniref:probable N-acetylgalactosaminyltransferase 8 isoform X2 n=1 Tax=Patella vulgata TaxID=6465 RepID=UPI0021806636|nr:probable N-acetylgalactosaminyltransferase 8 isoform X2 [Patella vulgata]
MYTLHVFSIWNGIWTFISRMKLWERYVTIAVTSVFGIFIFYVTLLKKEQAIIRCPYFSSSKPIRINDLAFLIDRKENIKITDGNGKTPELTTGGFVEQDLILSDVIPVNRNVPDSRHERCKEKDYDLSNETVSIIIGVYNEWPSILLRTIYSIITRTTIHFIKEIIIIDDASTSDFMRYDLARCIEELFSNELIKLIRVEDRAGILQAKQTGLQHATADIVVFLDCCVEVNHQWLEPLIHEIQQNRNTVALSVIDTINSTTFEYSWQEDFPQQQYGFDWSLSTFIIPYRKDTPEQDITQPYPGIIMTGTSFAVDRKFYYHLGEFDVGMHSSGGSQYIELSWRVWLCGGRLVHVPCSKIGHIPNQEDTTLDLYNYKRAIEVWMEPNLKQFVYDFYNNLTDLYAGDLSKQIWKKSRMSCHPFRRYLSNIWPGLLVYNEDVAAWGSGFSLTRDGVLITTLHCVNVAEYSSSSRPVLEKCLHGSLQKWTHVKRGQIKHVNSKLCLDLDYWGPIMKTCQSDKLTQQWMFTKYEY